ncbi:YggT family protein [Candidatus Daviesbacteria bacterium]|nr:YggT family protein [Candidatus Daviesbacteria bacterium]
MSLRNFLISFLDIVSGVISFFLGLRIILRLFSANPNTPFVEWIVKVSNSLIYPFHNIFRNLQLRNGETLDIVAIAALVIYLLVIYLIMEVIDIAFHPPQKHIPI